MTDFKCSFKGSFHVFYQPISHHTAGVNVPAQDLSKCNPPSGICPVYWTNMSRDIEYWFAFQLYFTLCNKWLVVLNQGLFKTIAVGDVFSAKNCSLNTLIMLNRDISTLQHFQQCFSYCFEVWGQEWGWKKLPENCTFVSSLYSPSLNK